MKKKLLAILLGAIMSLTCISAFVACTDGNGEGGGSQEESGGSQEEGGGSQEEGGGSTNDKTTVDNFDEWYAAIMDTLHSDNYSYDMSSVVDESLMIMSIKRQGANVCGTVEGVPTMYVVNGEHTQKCYSNYGGQWQYFEVSDGTMLQCGAYYDKLQFEISCFTSYDEVLSSAFCDALVGGYTSDSVFENEDDLKATAREIYEDVIYDEVAGTYTIEIVYQYSDIYSKYTYSFKFLNGKVSNVVANNGDTEITYSNFVYGGVSVTIPDEVLSPKTPEGPTEPKTTVDNFDEWYAAIMDTINSDNYTIHIDYSNITGANSSGDYKRQGNKIQVQLASDSEQTGYGVIGEKIITTYSYQSATAGDSSSGEWVPYEYEENAESENGAYYWPFQFKLVSFAMLDEGITMGLNHVLFSYSKDLKLESEEDLKASAAIIYKDVIYDEDEGSYTVCDKDSGVTSVLKFVNGKITYMYLDYAQGDWWVKTTYTFTYGGVSVTIPEEVLAATPQQ